MSTLKNNAKIAIIGGGVSGVTTALYLSHLGFHVTLFEQEKSLVCGPPFCHLHAGGNLYPDISDAQCVTLLKQSIDFLRFYPHVVDYRPTVIALPTYCTNHTANLLPRLKLLQKTYAKLIEKDEANEVLGKSEEYFKLYSHDTLKNLSKKTTPQQPQSADDWMIPVAKEIAYDKVQFPLILVQEYGLNLFRLAASASLALDTLDNVTLHYQSKVTDIHKKTDSWQIEYEINKQIHHETFDYLINAAGFRTGKIDDMIGVPCERMVEFKAAYISHWEKEKNTYFPEIIFHGERGTPKGMGQLTPYPQGYFQLHGMTKEITLYENGLVANTKQSCQPQLDNAFLTKIEKNWTQKETNTRTQNAIGHLATFIPSFASATVGSKPLFGAQQIPGDDPTLRVAEVTFPATRYARCEIVKVSSVLDMVEAITKNLMNLDNNTTTPIKPSNIKCFEAIKESEIDAYAKTLCTLREYPISLGKRNIKKNPSTPKNDDFDI